MNEAVHVHAHADKAEWKDFSRPDEVREFPKGRLELIRIGGAMIGRATFEPGWTWEKDEKPLLGSPDTCPMRHTGYCMAGNLVVRMVEANKETRIGKGDFFEIPPGHDAYVDGSEAVELILFAPPEGTH